ncbi:MAG TPA: LysR family transcriptional regulator [Oxalicibacterium sp.]|jgi:DNA-binding transcriptional LysR family regulator|nr:LysR family transcriptional regulator [Oxalicibacterium sp.]
MDKLQAMKTFVRVVEAGSFSAVANELNATQSAISKQVAGLEKELGVKLLTRTTRALALTEEGAQYFEHAQRLLSDVAEVEASVRRGKDQLTGWLRVASSVGFGRIKVLPIVHAFMKQHPSVRIDLRLHDGFIDLVEQGIDVSIRIGELPDSSLIARRVGTTQRMLLAHRDYVRSVKKTSGLPKVPEDLISYNCLVYTERAGRNAWTFTAGPGAAEQPGTEHLVRVGGTLQTNSSEVIRASVMAGMGIAYAPTWLFEEEIVSGEVQRLVPDWESPKLPIHLVSPPERRHSSKVRAFADYVSQAMAGQ